MRHRPILKVFRRIHQGSFVVLTFKEIFRILSSIIGLGFSICNSIIQVYEDYITSLRTQIFAVSTLLSSIDPSLLFHEILYAYEFQLPRSTLCPHLLPFLLSQIQNGLPMSLMNE